MAPGFLPVGAVLTPMDNQMLRAGRSFESRTARMDCTLHNVGERDEAAARVASSFARAIEQSGRSTSICVVFDWTYSGHPQASRIRYRLPDSAPVETNTDHDAIQKIAADLCEALG